MSTRRYHHGDLRAALLDRAERTLREKGPDQVTLRQLARDLCVSHAAPSRHFKDRQALLDALALIGFERLHDALAASQADAAATFAARLRALAGAYVGFVTENPALLNVMYTVKHEPNASAALVAAGQRLPEPAVALIAAGQRLGEVRQGPPERIGLPMFATLHGFADLAVATVLSPAQVAAGLDDVVDYILRGCR